MNQKISRRDLFKFIGGSAAGLVFTPVPWKLLDDAAIWTQNWSWVPTPLRGKFQTKYTTCSLCPAGCGVRVRCVGDQPVSLSGISEHPISHGAMCPVGLGGHHLSYNPARVLQPFKRNQSGSSPVSFDDAIAAIAGAITSVKPSGLHESVAVLDGQPGRTISSLYRRFLSEVPNGMYVTAPSSITFDVLSEMMGKESAQFGFDLENTKTILSFGAPIFDGWGTPGRTLQMLTRKDKNGDRRLHLIQVETRHSRTASLADSWIPINPGTEAAFALGLANVLISENLYDESTIRRAAKDFSLYKTLVSRFRPDVVAKITGVNGAAIVSTARDIAKQSPTLVVGSGDPGGGPLGREDEIAIWGLNFLLGSIGNTGGAIARRGIPDAPHTHTINAKPATGIENLPDHSIRLLILDEAQSGNAIPWSLIEKKIVRDGGVVVSLSPYMTTLARKADYVIPSPTYMETLRDVSTPADAPAATLSLSVPFIAPPTGVVEPVEFLRKLATSVGVSFGDDGARTLLPYVKRRVEAIYKSKSGIVFTSIDRKSVDVKNISSSDDLLKMLMDGGCWIDKYSNSKSVEQFSFFGKTSSQRLQDTAEGMLQMRGQSKKVYPLVLMPFGWRGASGSGQLSPVMTKVYQESNLRRTAQQAMLNPATGKAFGISDGKRMVIETESGSFTLEARLSASVMPDVIHVEVGPDGGALPAGQTNGEDILAICTIEENSTWRVTQARVREA
jgi:anaerobic selenocysteine-containing dehydrogenase